MTTPLHMVSEKIRLPADAKLRWLNLIYIKLLRVGGVFERKWQA